MESTEKTGEWKHTIKRQLCIIIIQVSAKLLHWTVLRKLIWLRLRNCAQQELFKWFNNIWI